MVAVHAEGLEQSGLPRAGRPHGDCRHRPALIVVPDEAARIGIRQPSSHRIPTVLGEGGRVEGRPLYDNPRQHVVRTDDLDAHVGTRERLAQVSSQLGPRLAWHPAALAQQSMDQRVSGDLEGRLARTQHPALGLGDVLREAVRQLLVPLRS